MLGDIGWEELLIILVILALVFGASRVASIGGALGRGIREFREEASKPESPREETSKAESLEDEADKQTAPSSGKSTQAD